MIIGLAHKVSEVKSGPMTCQLSVLWVQFILLSVGEMLILGTL